MNGHPFALCWRCSGIYLGIAAAALWTIGRTGGRARPPGNALSVALVLGMLPLLVDGWGQALGGWQTAAPLRFASGWALGIALPPFCLTLWGGNRVGDRRSVKGWTDALILLAVGVVAWEMLRMPSAGVQFLLRLAVNAGQLFFLLTIAASLALPLWRRWFRPLHQGEVRPR